MSREHLPPPPFPLSDPTLSDLRSEAEHYMRDHGGLLPPTKDWDYLIARYELAPHRFEHWHPRISSWIAEDLAIKAADAQVAVAIASPLVTPDVPVHCVPEPSSFALWSVGLLMIWLWLRVRRVFEQKHHQREMKAVVLATELEFGRAIAETRLGKYCYCPIKRGST